MSAAVVLAAGVVLGGAVLQALSGFGFALVVAPLLAVLLGPRVAVSDLALVSIVMHVALIGGRLRGGRLRAPAAPRVLAWALPGLALGAVALGRAPVGPLLLVVGLASLAGAAVFARPRVAVVPGTPVAPAGLAFGVLTTLTGTNGPPLVLHLLRRGAGADERRDTLFVCFLASSPVAIAALVLAGAWDPGPEWLLLAAAALLGAARGARLRPRVRAEPLRRLTLVLLAAAGATALIGAGLRW